MAFHDTTSRKIVARRIRNLRRGMRLTQRELAREFGVTPLAVHWWEHGVRVPQLKHQRTLYALEIALANQKLRRQSIRQA